MLCTKGRLSGHPWYWVSQSATLSDEGRVGWRECVCGGESLFSAASAAAVIARVLIVLPRHSRPASPVYLSVPRAGDVIVWSDATWWPAGDSIVRCHGTSTHRGRDWRAAPTRMMAMNTLSMQPAGTLVFTCCWINCECVIRALGASTQQGYWCCALDQLNRTIVSVCADPSVPPIGCGGAIIRSFIEYALCPAHGYSERITQ